MKKDVLITILLFLCTTLMAQELSVKSLQALSNSQPDSISYKLDNNGNQCALILIHSLKSGLEFEGWVVGNVDSKDDTYYVYMANNAKHLRIKHKDYTTKDIVFTDYGISSLEGGQTYVLYLSDNTKDIIDKVYSLGWNLNDFKVPGKVYAILNMAAKRGDEKAIIAISQLEAKKNSQLWTFDRSEYLMKSVDKLLEMGDSSFLTLMPAPLLYLYAEHIKSFETLHKDSRQREMLERYLDEYDLKDLQENRINTVACQYYLLAVEKGLKEAGDGFFRAYIRSKGLPNKSKDIMRLCMDSVSSGNVLAMNCLGYIFENGIGEEIDLQKSAIWYQKAYEKAKNPDMKRYLKYEVLDRVYGNKNYQIDDVTLDSIKKHAELGKPVALFQLGCMYEEGRNVEKNVEKAIELYSKAIIYTREAGDHIARILYEQKKFREAYYVGSSTLPSLRVFSVEEVLDNIYLKGLIGWHYNAELKDLELEARIFLRMKCLSILGYKKASDFLINNF